MAKGRTGRCVRLLAFCLCLLPLLWLVFRAFTAGLGANPVEKVLHHMGDWTLNILLLTLALAPLQKLTPTRWTGDAHRVAGLFALFYASLHFTVYAVFEHSLSLASILEDAVRHKRIYVGSAAFVLLLVQAVSSVRGMRARLGTALWRRLHRFVYLSAAGGVAHYLWLVKKDLRAPLLYAAAFSFLLLYRAAIWLRRKKTSAESNTVAERRITHGDED